MANHDAPRDGYVHVNGLRLHYLDWGNPQAPLLLLIHGLQDCARSFDFAAPYLAKKFRVLALDHRGHGDSQWSRDAAYKYTDYVNEVAAFADALGLRRFFLMGHSAGGRDAFGYAAMHPERVEGLVIIDIDPDPVNPDTSRMFRRYLTEPDEWPSLAAVVERLRSREPNAPEEVLEHHALHMTRELPGGRRQWKRDRALLYAYERLDLWGYWRSVTCPVLLLRGALSGLLTIELASKMQQEARSCKLVELPDGRHWCYDESLDAFLAALKGFLALP
ncbi:MAG: alpha/beta hydrolase [Chloroflexi bacterium]|nr:alpha/beta hydrolase [Chloroflexota bacterium]